MKNSISLKSLPSQWFTGRVGIFTSIKKTKIVFKLLIVSFCMTLMACGVTIASRSMTEVLPVVVVPGAPLPSELSLALGVAIAQPNIDLGAGESFVNSVRVRNLTLNILDASESDANDDGAEDSFDFLTDLSVTLRADFDGQTQELLIATLPDGDPQFGTAARILNLTVVNSEADVLDFILASGGYQVVLNLGGQIPPDNVLLSGTIRYRVDIGFN